MSRPGFSQGQIERGKKDQLEREEGRKEGKYESPYEIENLTDSHSPEMNLTAFQRNRNSTHIHRHSTHIHRNRSDKNSRTIICDFKPLSFFCSRAPEPSPASDSEANTALRGFLRWALGLAAGG